ncbi:MAG TPA: hypothetical protein VFS37_04295 [Conexibacter sp.]|nr:hypothetical protein [Conexibacter sp.]
MQFEFPWALGPADGRYVVREAAGEAASHVLVLATLGAPERRRMRDRRGRAAAPEPPPTPVTTSRATVVDAEATTRDDAERWLAAADAGAAQAALALVARAVRAHRVASADPAVREPSLAQALVVRAGYGGGEQVAAGRWSAARELPPPRAARRPRAAGLAPQERTAALLGGHARALACEELALRARADLDAGLLRQAALQLHAALEAAIAELSPRDGSADPRARVAELREYRPEIAELAHGALADAVPADAFERLDAALQRLEAALRARNAGIV